MFNVHYVRKVENGKQLTVCYMSEDLKPVLSKIFSMSKFFNIIPKAKSNIALNNKLGENGIGYKVHAMGIAKLNPDDKFDQKAGEKLAYKKARRMLLKKKTQYLNNFGYDLNNIVCRICSKNESYYIERHILEKTIGK